MYSYLSLCFCFFFSVFCNSPPDFNFGLVGYWNPFLSNVTLTLLCAHCRYASSAVAAWPLSIIALRNKQIAACYFGALDILCQCQSAATCIVLCHINCAFDHQSNNPNSLSFDKFGLALQLLPMSDCWVQNSYCILKLFPMLQLLSSE